MSARDRTITQRDRELFISRQCAETDPHPEHFFRPAGTSFICPGRAGADARTIDAATDVIRKSRRAHLDLALEPRQLDRLHAEALAAAGLLAGDSRRDTIIDATVAQGHAHALWHTMWFHAIQYARLTGPDLITDEDEARAYDMDAAEVADYNEWQISRDFNAERARHLAVFQACRAALRSWGWHVPDDPDAVANFHTAELWEAHNLLSALAAVDAYEAAPTGEPSPATLRAQSEWHQPPA